MGRKSWAHQELSPKRVKKYAALLSAEDLRVEIESRGMEPVFVGSDFESGQLLWVLDNDVFNRYEVMVEINEDMVWEYAVRRYVFENEYRKFEDMKDLEDYVDHLNREKHLRP
ncbi:MAG TPA: hypothetical protein VIP46_18665 [Pyrinomonadaceae bacterium]